MERPCHRARHGFLRLRSLHYQVWLGVTANDHRKCQKRYHLDLFHVRACLWAGPREFFMALVDRLHHPPLRRLHLQRDPRHSSSWL